MNEQYSVCCVPEKRILVRCSRVIPLDYGSPRRLNLKKHIYSKNEERYRYKRVI